MSSTRRRPAPGPQASSYRYASRPPFPTSSRPGRRALSRLHTRGRRQSTNGYMVAWWVPHARARPEALDCRHPCPRRTTRPGRLALLETVPGIGGEAGRGSYLAEDDEGRTLVAAFDTDRVLDALQAAHPGTLDGRLDVVPRQHGGRRRRTVEIESTPLQRRLHRGALPGVQHLALRRAPGTDRDREAEPDQHPRLRHLGSSSVPNRLCEHRRTRTSIALRPPTCLAI